MRITDATLLADAWPTHHLGTGGGIAMVLTLVLFLGAVVVLVFDLLRGGFASRSNTSDEILRRRLAEGEISVAEYEQLRTALDPRRPPRTATTTLRPGQVLIPPTAQHLARDLTSRKDTPWTPPHAHANRGQTQPRASR